ncbi:hypothetical protein [Marinobacter nauticus]|uniref:hypothetical protein n=1 Tax=Marinobacter nauticus TaxID=2743 RepID=UPI000EB28EE7|nr:hypothetical protein [Marinobacter nauticus]RKR78179.1 hypothetical protein C7436_1892 [Marinobacter nauticus]TPW22666.1 hypothetical protein FH712_16095 [Marinobacter nauticus]
MFKVSLALLATVIVSGCASTFKFDSEYQTVNDAEQYGDVSANVTRIQGGGFSASSTSTYMEVFIRDELVLKAPVSPDYTGEYYFLYHGEPVTIDCIQPALFIPAPECKVMINGKRAGLLTFELQK